MHKYSKSICIKGRTQELAGLGINFYDTHDTVLSTEDKWSSRVSSYISSKNLKLRSMIRTGQLEMLLAFRRICIATI